MVKHFFTLQHHGGTRIKLDMIIVYVAEFLAYSKHLLMFSIPSTKITKLFQIHKIPYKTIKSTKIN